MKILESVGVTLILEKMVENRLWWFEHVERRHVDSLVKRVGKMKRNQTTRGRGRPRKTIREIIKKDIEINDLNRSMVLDRILCQKLIHIAYLLSGIRLGCCVNYSQDVILVLMC